MPMRIQYNGVTFEVTDEALQHSILQTLGLFPKKTEKPKAFTLRKRTRKYTPYTNYTDEDDLKIAELYEQGRSYKTIADMTNRTEGAVAVRVWRLKKSGVIKSYRHEMSPKKYVPARS